MAVNQTVRTTVKSALLWDLTRRRLVVCYRCFGTTYRSDPQGSSIPRAAWPSKMGLIGCPKISLTNYQSTLCNIWEERRSHLHASGSLNLRKEQKSIRDFYSIVNEFRPFKVQLPCCQQGRFSVWAFKSSEMWPSVMGSFVPTISEDCGTFIFKGPAIQCSKTAWPLKA
jgi:hypothetical protein